MDGWTDGGQGPADSETRGMTIMTVLMFFVCITAGNFLFFFFSLYFLVFSLTVGRYLSDLSERWLSAFNFTSAWAQLLVTGDFFYVSHTTYVFGSWF